MQAAVLNEVLRGAGKTPGQHTFIRLNAAPVTELLIVTSVPDQACTLPQGNKQTLMGILNKQDYARWHSYQFYCSVGDADATIRPEGALDVSTCTPLSLVCPDEGCSASCSNTGVQSSSPSSRGLPVRA